MSCNQPLPSSSADARKAFDEIAPRLFRWAPTPCSYFFISFL
uniref:Uncharacterized protein n=1 Tax=Arundo donax TaxID=35708 RepID=A0A0A9C877_ARUDO